MHGSHANAPPRAQLRTDPAVTLSLVGKVLASDTPFIKAVQYAQWRPDDPDLVQVVAMVGDVGRFQGPSTISAGGTATSRQRALVKAVGEGVERYCAELYDPARVFRAAYRDVGEDAIDPRRFVLFHETQFADPGFRYVPLKDTDVIGWTSGYSLTRGRPVHLPALSALIGHSLTFMEPIWAATDVSGYACGNTLEEAILSGLLELIERDAVMLFWYHRLPTPAVPTTVAADPEVQDILARFARAPGRVFLSDLTTDLGVPVVVAQLVTNGVGRPAAVVASAADLTAPRAAARALLELGANNHAVRTFYEARLQRGLPTAPWSLTSQEDHGLLYADPAMLPHLWPLLPQGVPRERESPPWEGADLKQSIEQVVAQLASLGHEVLFVDLTHPTAADLGLHVVKVLAPGLRPIDLVGHYHLGGERLYGAPQRMGYSGTATHPAGLNPMPSPFM
jgi:ribosomal protein S12 methylthiotransferase accessory factor